MKPHFLTIALLFAPLCHADTVILLDGTKLEGKVLHEDAEKCVIEVLVTRTIRDEQTILKSKIKQILKEEPDSIAFTAIANMAKMPELQPLSEYNSRIGAVEKFLTDFPNSTKRPEAKNILAALQPERDAIATGAIKFGGKLISAKDRAADLYDIDAKIMASQIAQLANSNQIIPALRKFVEFEHDFGGSAVFLSKLPFHVGMMQTFQARVAASAADQPALVKKRETDFSMMSASDRARALQIVKDETQEYTKRIATEKAAKEKWLSLDPYQKDILTDTARNLEQEVHRLQNYKPSYGTGAVEPGETFRQAWKTMTTSTDAKTIATALQTAQSAKLPERYISVLKQAQKPGTAPH